MQAFLSSVFTPNGLTPHGFCLLWDPGLIWLHAGSDFVIALAYYSIPLALIALLRRRRNLVFGWVAWLFVLFILACGTTHAMAVITLWRPLYWIEGGLKAITALLSLTTAFILWPLLPRILALPSPEELTVARDAAYAASRAKSTFLATISHELRTPLTGILGMIGLLKSNPPLEQRNVFIAALDESAQVLLTLIGDVLDFSKIEAGHLSLEYIGFDIRRTLDAVIGLYDNAASAKGLVLRLTYHGRMPPDVVISDPTRLRQVLSNFVSNAIKFTSGGGIAIDVYVPPAERPDVLWRFEVRDTGNGIDSATQSQLFEAFTQADSSVARRFGGSGLGLAICKRLVTAMGGDIGVESVLGEGSCFWFTLPIKTGSPTDLVSDPQPKMPFVSQKRLNVLVAEDNTVNQLLISVLLEQMGHKVDCVNDGALVLQAIGSRSYDVILMDVQMPEMDGFEAMKAIRATEGKDSAIPIVALTADTVPEHLENYRNSGFDDVLNKPIDIAALQAALARIIDSARTGATSDDRETAGLAEPA